MAKITAMDMEYVRRSLGSRLDCAERLPFSFALGGRKHNGLPPEFNPRCEKRTVDAGIIERIWTGRAGVLLIKAECLEYKDSPTFEWTVYITNDGNDNSPVVSDFCGIDSTLETYGRTVLYHNNGDYCSRDGLETSETALEPGEIFRAGSVNGRSCDRALPYYRLISDGYGLNVAIGWPGTWCCSFERTDKGVHVTAKQKDTNFYLKPGETIRSPRMLVMGFEGGAERGINVWRHFYFRHMLCRSKGGALGPKICASYHGGGEEFTLATEENQRAAIEFLINRGFKPDIWWIDAGWYPCKDKNGVKRWVRTGDWRPDPEKFPNGLGPVGKLCKENGIQLLLWFEPERIMPEYWPESNPKEFAMGLITKSDTDWLNRNSLLYLGNEEAREWLTERVKSIILDGNVEIYRQDFNGDPFPQLIWNQNDIEENRSGITENLHIQGYLKFWDDLLADVPDLWIDSCASGGRRNDIEAMRRAVALHPTDYGYGEHPVKQAFQKTFFEWTPYFRSIAASWDDEDGNYGTGKPRAHGYDSYAMHCAFAPATSFGSGYGADGQSFDKAVELAALEKKAAAYTLSSDFYCLLPVRKSNEDCFSIQFDRPQTRDGLVQVIRNSRCGQESVTVFPRGINEGALYEFSIPERNENFRISGDRLVSDGLTVSIPKRSGLFLFYRELT